MSESKGKFEAGLAGVVAGQTAVGEVTQTSLRYRGYEIADLAAHATFDEVGHLLLHGELPNAAELRAFRGRVQAAMNLPGTVTKAIDAMPLETPPMDVLRSVVSLLGHYDPEAQDNGREANLRKSERLIGQIAYATGYWCRKVGNNPELSPTENATHGENLLTLMLGKNPSVLAGRVMDGTLVLYAEHEFNASTFTARTIASTLADMHSAVTGAIGALKGPLHGGANEAAMRQFLEIGKVENVRKWFDDLEAHNQANPNRKKLIMGFGHRVYKHGDHRAAILRDWSLKLSEETGQRHWIDMADALQKIMLERKNIHPNTDYPAAHAYYQMGIPIPMFTPLFVCARITGWCAHIMEQCENNRIIRPGSEYVGVPPREVGAIANR
ncbi:MAG TPA: citrate/2-methylcitrate synthase [Phycisphaerae bacterium]|nr:citrate/2-methylcitrate synthase [Phycisphaerae bacterium]